MDKNKIHIKILLLGMMIILGLATAVYGAIYIASSLCALYERINPMMSMTLPILVRYHQHFRENATSVSLVLGETQNNTFVFHENITLKPYQLDLSTYFYESFTTQKYSSDQTIQLSAYINGSKYGITHNLTLPRIRLNDMEKPDLIDENAKWIVNAFYIRLDPTQTGQTLVIRNWFGEHSDLYTNKVSFWFVRTIPW